MKLVIHSLLASILIHIIYFFVTMMIGYIKTVRFNPTIEMHNAHMLQNEVAFGYVLSPWVFLLSITVVASLSGLVFSVRANKRSSNA